MLMLRLERVRVTLIRMNKIYELRRARGWSQEHLAQVSGLSRPTIQRLESGRKPSLESAQSLAAVFGLDAKQILSAVGVAGELARVMRISESRDATKKELSRLPEDIRGHLVAFYSARSNAQRTLANLETATEQWVAHSDDRLAVLDRQLELLCHLNTKPGDLELHARLAETSSRFQELTREVAIQSELMMAARTAAIQATRPYQEAALQLALTFARLSN